MSVDASYTIGKNFIIKVVEKPASGNPTTVAVLGQRSGTFTFTNDMIETTVKADWPNKKYTPGFCGWECSVAGAYNIGTSEGTGAVIGPLALQGKECVVECSVGGDVWKGNGYIESISLSGEYTDISTYDVKIKGSGTMTCTPAS